MKVAIISFFMMETSIPLAKHLSLAGIDVDLYSLLPYESQNTYVYDFIEDKQPIGFVKTENQRKAMGKKLCDYLMDINTKIFIWPTKRFQRLFLVDLYYGYLLAKRINKQDYDITHIIHASKRFWVFLYIFLKKNKIVQTLHEVTPREAKSSFLDSLKLKLLISDSIPIIFHSNTSKERFIALKRNISKKEISNENLTMIRFGLFETYQCFKNESVNRNKNGKMNILTFGRITPSKGINFLVEAVKIIKNKYPIHLVIAGNGEPYFDFSGIKSYEFINRFISNEEIVSMIETSDVIVLPYVSASQSGVPMTAFAFNKPIIASNIAGFKEVIDHMETGLLVDNLNTQSLASSIEILAKNKELRAAMSRNIEKKYREGEFSWESIAEKTIFFYKQQLPNIKSVEK
jgi:glycosyltransferase involved in cell wall biosynthesis